MVDQISTVTLVIFLVAGILDVSDSATNELASPPDTGCACTGSVLTYTCTAVGTGNTLWTGTAFDCATNGIILRHERFTQSGGAVGECNGGPIQGRSIRVENNCYTSQIDVMVSDAFNNKTIQCIHNSGTGINIIDTSVITVVEAPYPQPNNVHLIDINQEKLTFGWDSLGPDCESAMYGISSTCGSCGPTSTNATTVDCFDFHLSSDVSSCTFSVNLVLCGNTGPSSSATVTLKVPDIPRATITPVYSADNKTLLRIVLVLHQEDSFDIADGISGAVLSYITNLNSGLSVVNSTCEDDICEYAVGFPSSICSSSPIINVTVSATNVLGEGPPSDPVVTECTNRFVEVQYNSATSTISCVFLSELDTSEKSCSILYGVCDQEQTKMAVGNTTSSSVMLKVDVTGSYCYTLVARNGTYTIMVDGRIDNFRGSPSEPLVEIVVPVVIIVIILVISIAILIISIALTTRYRRKLILTQPDAELLDMIPKKRFTDDDLAELKPKPVDENEWILSKYDVPSDCSLKEFIDEKKLIFKRGRAFYEFKNETESITEDQQLILVEIDGGKYFNLDADPEELREKGLIGEAALQPSLSKFKVLVQSTGLGARHLASGSTLLYVKPRPHPLWNVDPTQFKELQITKDCTLQAFCEEHHLDPTKCSMYVECDDFQMKQRRDDVIVMDKDTNKLLTGPYAHHVIKKGAEDTVRQKWRVFLWSVDEKDLRLKKDTTVLCKIQEKQDLVGNQQHGSKQRLYPPLLRINNSEQLQFKMRTLDRNYNFKEFCSLPSVSVDPNERNVFLEAGWMKMDGSRSNTYDVILMDKDTEEFYTGPSAFDEVQSYRRDKGAKERKFKAFVLSDFHDKLLLSKNASVLYRMHKKQWQPEALVPISSKYLMELTIGKECKVGEFYEARKLTRDDHKYIFVERNHFDEKERIDDVILLDKVSKELFTYPSPWLVVRKQLTDENGKIREGIREQWRVFAACKTKKGLTFAEDTPVLVQDPRTYTEKFQVLKVDRNNVRMSEFIREKIGSFESGKAFYQFNQPEDLPCYREIVHVPMSLYDRLTIEQKPPVSTELPQCSGFASVDFFYKIPGVPGFEVRPPPSSVYKVFIQCTSQGSRCLKTGMVILYEVQ